MNRRQLVKSKSLRLDAKFLAKPSSASALSRRHIEPSLTTFTWAQLSTLHSVSRP